jgi:thiol-disulfide isomerase/thioredoxin
MPAIRPFRALAAMFALLSTVLLPGRSSAAAGDLPRYDLPVGRMLSYSYESNSKNADGSPGYGGRQTDLAIVVAANADGSRRVVLRHAMAIADNPEEVSIGAFDVFTDGRAKRVSRFNSDVDSSLVFPLLPPDATSAQSKWVSPASWSGTVTTYSATPSQPVDEFVFNTVNHAPIHQVYELTNKATTTFDRRKGIFLARQDELTMEYGGKRTMAGEYKLEKDEMIDAVRTARLAAEYDKLFQADAKCFQYLMRIGDEPAIAEKLAGQAKDALTAVAKSIEDPDVVRDYQRMLKGQEENSKADVEDARRILGLLGKPFAHWESKDLDGKMWSRDGLKGKVVVMDFWYRGCPWCMYAMPAVKQLAADYKDKGVVVLGMNTDRKEEDAKFVVKTLELAYPQVRAEGMSKVLGVESFPTLIVVDQEGVIRHLHAGYSPDLHDRVARHIDELLQQKPAEPPRP